MAGKSRHGAHRGPRSPFVLNISRLGLRPGSTMGFHETVVAPARIGIELIAIPAGAPLDVDVELHSITDGVAVTGTVSAPTEGECARCLTRVTGTVQIHLDELFDYRDDAKDNAKNGANDDATEDDDVGYVISDESGDSVDLEQPIIDAVGMMLPFSPVCRDDCPGLCPECGVPLADFEGSDEGHHHDVIDPRWAKLAAMKTSGQEGAPDRSAGDSE